MRRADWLLVLGAINATLGAGRRTRAHGGESVRGGGRASPQAASTTGLSSLSTPQKRLSGRMTVELPTHTYHTLLVGLLQAEQRHRDKRPQRAGRPDERLPSSNLAVEEDAPQAGDDELDRHHLRHRDRVASVGLPLERRADRAAEVPEDPRGGAHRKNKPRQMSHGYTSQVRRQYEGRKLVCKHRHRPA